MRFMALLVLGWLWALPSRADSTLHCLWELHGQHNTVYLLGSIHVLRASDYPLAPAILDAYANSASLVFEIDLQSVDMQALAAQLLASATLPPGTTLATVLGPERYSRAVAAAQKLHLDLAGYDGFAPWFAAEAIQETQLSRLGFDPKAGVDMFLMERARADHKPMSGLETAQDQVALFQSMSTQSQSAYLLTSLSQAQTLPADVEAMVRAWQHGDSAWFAQVLKAEFGDDPALYRDLLVGRNRKWLPQVEALLQDSKNYLVTVGAGHLTGTDSLIAMLRRDGFPAIQR